MRCRSGFRFSVGCTSTVRRKKGPHLRRTYAVSGFPVLVHLNGVARALLKYAMNRSISSLISCFEAKLLLAHENGEADLDLVKPGSVLGREVKADAMVGIAAETPRG
jgi:hypothetical protein